MGEIEPEHPELFALEFGKIAEYDLVYTLSSTNIDQSAPKDPIQEWTHTIFIICKDCLISCYSKNK